MPTTGAVVKKRALLLSNSSYVELPSLLFSTSDVEDLSVRLRRLNFDVTVDLNSPFEQMDTIVDDFVNSIGERDTVFFFFNGHAASWKNQNFLLPVDDDEIINSGMLQYHAINAGKLLQQIVGRDPSAVIFLLDASYSRDPSESPFKSVGLCSMAAPLGSLVMFTCGVGQTTDNVSRNDRNGLFMEQLLQYIHLSHWTIEEVLERVRRDVENQTDGEQMPFLSNSLRSRRTYLDLQHRKGTNFHAFSSLEFSSFSASVSRRYSSDGSMDPTQLHRRRRPRLGRGFESTVESLGVVR